MTKKKMGRDLSALLGRSQSAVAIKNVEQPDDNQPVTDDELRHLPIEWIQPGRYQPRRDIQPEALEELAASIKAQGLMQPIVVRSLAGQQQKFEIIAGERRWRACQLAGFDRVPVMVREVADEAAIAMALIENIQRENLNPMEEAMALHRLQNEFDLTQLEVGEAVGKGRATVANLLRLMNLNDEVKRLLEHGDIEMGHARALLGLEGEQQSSAARQVVSKALTVRQTEALVRDWDKPEKVSPAAALDPDIQRLERLLGDRLGAKVAIQHTTKGKGKLVINYTNLDELDGILDHIK